MGRLTNAGLVALLFGALATAGCTPRQISLIPPQHTAIGRYEGIVNSESNVRERNRISIYELTLSNSKVGIAGQKEDLKSIEEYIEPGDDVTVMYSDIIKIGGRDYVIDGRVIIDRHAEGHLRREVIHF